MVLHLLNFQKDILIKGNEYLCQKQLDPIILAKYSFRGSLTYIQHSRKHCRSIIFSFNFQYLKSNHINFLKNL